MIKLNHCPVCSHPRIKPVYQRKWKDSSFHQCTSCRLIFQNPQENPDRTFRRYEKEYFEYEVANQHNFFNLIRLTLEQFDILKRLDPSSRILEIGSATGLFLKHMSEHSHRATGLEICKESVEYGLKHYDVDLRNITLEEADFTENSFDFIHFSHLIEHLNNPCFFLKKVYELLKPGGLALITTPNADGFFSGFYQESWRCIVDDHLFIFNPRNMNILLQQNRFKVLEMKTWGSIPAGNTWKWIKKITDYLVKKTKTGDVMCFLVQK